tara:strand:+ start:85 stop:234 length:150 start_codon:yes stop_codon:yes gene_type:complete
MGREKQKNEYLQVGGETGASGEAARENAQQKVEDVKKTWKSNELSIIGA